MKDSAPQLLIHCCELAQVDAQLEEAYTALLNPQELTRLHSFSDKTARRSFLVARALLRTQLAAQLQLDPTHLHFTRDANNKPQLQIPVATWQFNLSHAGSWVVLALSNCGAVGIDVEQQLRPSRLESISARFFSKAEHAALLTLPEPERRQRFFELWTLKESYVKALGRGIATALAGTDIVYTDAASVTLNLHGAARCAGAVHCWHYQLTANYSLALALITDRQNAPAPRVFDTVVLRSSEARTLPAHLRGIGAQSGPA